MVPGVKTARLPDFEGATRDDRRRRVPLGVLAPSAALHLFAADNRARRQGARPQDFTASAISPGLRIAIESGTLGDAILMTFDKGRLIDNITHLVPGRSDLLGALDRGDFDATLLDLRRFDAYRAAHPDSRLAASGYYYPIGANRGYVGLASDPALIEAGQQGAVGTAGRGHDRATGASGGADILAPARTDHPRRRLAAGAEQVAATAGGYPLAPRWGDVAETEAPQSSTAISGYVGVGVGVGTCW